MKLNKSQAIEVRQAQITIGDIIVDCYRDDKSGKYYLSQNGLAKNTNIDHTSIARLPKSLKELLGSDFLIVKGFCINNNKGGISQISLIEFKYFPTFLGYYAQKGNETAKELWNKMYPDNQIFSIKSKKQPKKQGYIYLFESSSILKLGYSTNVEQRLKELSRWKGELEIVAVIEGTINKEKSLHSILHGSGDYFGDEWYPTYRKHEILRLMDVKDQELKKTGKITLIES